ncbi:MAG TPA: DUF4235 domain-containing protein [Mycobacteriales bacterium]|nr:DUF4235 domain-containing protein [Mycobacteriales bacterium]
MKWVYRPFGLALGMLAAVLANALVRKVWSSVSDDGVPTARQRNSSWAEVAGSAVLQGAVMGGTRALVDRAGAKGFEKATGTWPE